MSGIEAGRPAIQLVGGDGAACDPEGGVCELPDTSPNPDTAHA